jgi:plasmid stability protein
MRMSNVQVKNLDESLHEELRERAAAQGTTISDYVLELIRRDLRTPSRREWLASAAALPRHDLTRDEVTGALDAERGHR